MNGVTGWDKTATADINNDGLKDTITVSFDSHMKGSGAEVTVTYGAPTDHETPDTVIMGTAYGYTKYEIEDISFPGLYDGQNGTYTIDLDGSNSFAEPTLTHESNGKTQTIDWN